MNSLKPCPFCGYEADYHETYHRNHRIGCTGCKIIICGDTKEEVFSKWNRRAMPEYPKVEWRGHLAYVNDELIGDVSRRGSIWRPSLCSRRYEPTRTEDQAKYVVESAWKEFWAKIRGGK